MGKSAPPQAGRKQRRKKAWKYGIIAMSGQASSVPAVNAAPTPGRKSCRSFCPSVFHDWDSLVTFRCSKLDAYPCLIPVKSSGYKTIRNYYTHWCQILYMLPKKFETFFPIVCRAGAGKITWFRKPSKERSFKLGFRYSKSIA